MLDELTAELNIHGVDLVRTVDISMLPANQNRGYNIALWLGIVLSPGYISRLSNESILDRSEFSEKEHRADQLGEWTADFIMAKGYDAFAQSERNLDMNGFFDENTKTTPLPHKTIAIMAGLGWIGKNNLLITQEYGCALCMCTVLTHAPLPVESRPIIMPKCGVCTVCINVCQEDAIHGAAWELGMSRDLIVDVYQCNTCLKCLVHCPWTQKYMKSNR